MSDQPELSSYAARNRQTWDAQSSEYQSKHAAQLELRPPADATSSYRDEPDLAWARRWPMEHIWRVRRAHAVHP
jgi:hypothetical protein